MEMDSLEWKWIGNGNGLRWPKTDMDILVTVVDMKVIMNVMGDGNELTGIRNEFTRMEMESMVMEMD